MQVDVFAFPTRSRPARFHTKTAVVIDVLRATTSMTTALSNGAIEVRAAASIPEARSMARKLGRKDVLLCGERGGMVIPGFDLGNSPREFTRKTVEGKRLIMATTNGTKAVRWAEGARTVLIASFINAGEVARRLLKVNGDIAIVCSGKEGAFSLEDSACAGLLVAEICRRKAGAQPNDLAMACAALYSQWKRCLRRLLASADHGVYLTGLGLGKDLEVCAKVDQIKAVPMWKNGRITVGK
jgi:2-phosphosulfolactate phosphatase